jgi:hypothetical protein
MKMHYRIKQYLVDDAVRRSESLYALAPEKWRLVDNRKAYIKKRMAIEGLK